MNEHEASRTLVKSPPELWAECSDAASLARHLGQFGEITITRLEPETAVAWEGERASGTVRLEPSGWGTKVVLTATPFGTQEPPAQAGTSPAPAGPLTIVEPPAAVEPLPAPVAIEAAPAPEPPTPRLGFFARLRRWMGGGGPAQPEPAPAPADPPTPVVEPECVTVEPEPVSAPEPEPVASANAPHPAEVLTAALDSLGQAHHRPYSRS